METSASFEARSAPLPYPTTRKEQRFLAQSVLPKRLAPSHNDHRDPALGRLEFTYQRTWKELPCRLSNPVVKKSAELLSLSQGQRSLFAVCLTTLSPRVPVPFLELLSPFSRGFGLEFALTCSGS
jgi:hypothetical protein